MTGVILRCRTCGTPQDHAGECDACSAGPVAYFCGNHDPGLWLDGPACQRCAAHVDDAPAMPTPVPARATTTRVSRVPRPATRPATGAVSGAGGETVAPSLADLIVEMAEEGRRVRASAADRRLTPRAVSGVGLPIAGCVFRVFLLLVFLGGLAVVAVFMLLNGAF